MGKLIALIYFYLISAVSIGLLVFATFAWANLIINLTQYGQYPLRYGLENCEYRPLVKGPYPVDSLTPATMSAQEKEEAKRICLEQVELERKQQKLEDIKNSAVFTLVGVVLFLIHFPQARRLSKQ